MTWASNRWNNDTRKSPCYHCPDRTEHGRCHATCEKYLKDCEEQKKAKEELQKHAATDEFYKAMKAPKSPKRVTVRGEVKCRTSPRK